MSLASPQRILLVEDEPGLREVLTLALEGAGFCCEATSGIEEGLLSDEDRQWFITRGPGEMIERVSHRIVRENRVLFPLVDRGKGLMAAEQERALAGGGEMRVGSNIGKGQMKAAITCWCLTLPTAMRMPVGPTSAAFSVA